MPYLVTTKRPCSKCGSALTCPDAPVSRVAVATLEEAQTRALLATLPYSLVTQPEEDNALMAACRAVSESGGTVGPLPDGSLIEVEPRQWYQLAEAVGWHPDADAHRDEAELLAAFNRGEPMIDPDEPRPLTLTRHEQVQAIVAIDVLLAVARTPGIAQTAVFRPEIDASIREVERLRAKIREGLK